MFETSSAYTVKAGNFEGPLPLLIELIEKRKLFVNELSLAQVTDDYVQYIRSLSELHIGDTANFILTAATLILIKSRSLLPNLELSVEEEKDIVDLEARLKAYQVIKEIGESIKQQFGKQIIFPAPERKENQWNTPVFSPDTQITIWRMRQAMADVISQIPPQKEKLPEVTVRKVINIEEMIDGLTERIQKAVKLSFKEFSKSTSSDPKEQKIYTIVSFLAMLELVRSGIIDVIQGNHFEDIEIEKQEPLMPTI